MENLRDEKLNEIKLMLQEVSKRLAEAEARIAELEAQLAESEASASAEPVADIEVAAVEEAATVAPMDDVISMDDIVDAWDEPAAEAPAPVSDVAKEESLADIFGEASDEGTLNAKHRASRKSGVNDMMTKAEAWRTDLPGSAVKDIRSAISLNDRIRFIRELFAEDAEKFQAVMEAINGMETLDEVVDFVKENNPSWNFNSDVVYRFMMAVRRKVR